MALLMLLVGAVLVVAGAAAVSLAAALMCGGVLVMAGAVALAAVQERQDSKAAVE
jgi:hypothetical protein